MGNTYQQHFTCVHPHLVSEKSHSFQILRNFVPAREKKIQFQAKIKTLINIFGNYLCVEKGSSSDCRSHISGGHHQNSCSQSCHWCIPNTFLMRATPADIGQEAQEGSWQTDRAHHKSLSTPFILLQMSISVWEILVGQDENISSVFLCGIPDVPEVARDHNGYLLSQQSAVQHRWAASGHWEVSVPTTWQALV